MLHLIMRDRVRELLESGSQNLTGQLRNFLRANLTSAHCSLESAALYFGLHSRAFRRRLAVEGGSFRRIRERVRFEMACQLLRDTRSTAGEIASQLGYADASAFTRAFSHQAGVGPARWRAAAAGRGGNQGACESTVTCNKTGGQAKRRWLRRSRELVR
jgi:AraC-like DNA-binding protein